MTPPLVGYDAYAHYARNLMTKIVSTGPTGIPIARAVDIRPTDPVGIIGAGPGGLYTALMLDDLGIPYKIIEARGRVGGRLFTYTFPDGTGAPYNYFDVGAMRYPDTESMKRIFHLFNYALSTRTEFRWLLVYVHFSSRVEEITTPYSRTTAKEVIQDTSASDIDAFIKIGPAKMSTMSFSGGTSHDGWDYMMQYDMYSTRAYMAIAYKPSEALLNEGMPDGPLPTDVINWCETFDKSTGWYDRAFSETVLEAIAFGWNPDPDAPATNWYCLDGGSFKIAEAMYTYLNKKNPSAFVFNSRVTAISSIDETHAEVTVNGGQKYKFSSVVCTIPLPVLRTIDLSAAGLSGMQSAACAISIMDPQSKLECNSVLLVGGQTYTDRPLRTVVYPSFGTSVQAGTTTTLIASYCWTEDATRLGALINKDKDILRDLTLRELAYLHNVTYDFLRDQLIDTFAWSWTNDPYTMGAFAFFGPGKFANVYASLNAPAGKGNIMFAGEALSIRHAWRPCASQKFLEDWGANPEWVTQPPPAKRVPDGKRRAFPAPAIPTPAIPTPAIPKWSMDNIFDPENSLLFRLVALSGADSA
ncbi:hypothetical protein CPB84DRAFT_1856086 [Gymnopilus junonius]|uniref:Amine oxidase domain-containing protein n=1 Tax=Gymnopilus junonius TaxID=109634 RepID=A0A9P5N6T2_GYMJU|nr:hypothetical protein CPB84DRAFT_1856086 [Gymnopilus junonius]